jgi:hypothetical protein
MAAITILAGLRAGHVWSAPRVGVVPSKSAKDKEATASASYNLVLI